MLYNSASSLHFYHMQAFGNMNNFFFFAFLTVKEGWLAFLFSSLSLIFFLSCCVFSCLIVLWFLPTFLFVRCHWKTEKGQRAPRTLAVYLSAPYHFCGNQPGFSLLKKYCHTGQRHLRWSAMLWITSCPWPAAWMDPQESQCLVCSLSASSRSVFCLLW